MTYGNEVYKGVDMFFELLLLEEYLFGIRVAFRRSKALGEAVEAFLSFIDIGSGIGHFAKFHIGPPFDRPNMSHPRKAHRERLMPSGVIRLFPVLSGSRNGAGSVCAAPFGKVRPNHARLFEAPDRIETHFKRHIPGRSAPLRIVPGIYCTFFYCYYTRFTHNNQQFLQKTVYKFLTKRFFCE